MAKMALAYTSGGVESVALIDEDALISLAIWLCNDNEYHHEKEKCHTMQTSDKEFDSQMKKQGYCNTCRDFAGEILSHFNLVKESVTL